MSKRVFIRGDLSFTINGQTLIYRRKNISLQGADGMSWGPLSPEHHFGVPILVSVKISETTTFSFKTPAYLVRELTGAQVLMGIRFHLDSSNELQLAQAIAKGGHAVTKNNRLYPRIPSDEKIQTFPMHAVVYLKGLKKSGVPFPVVMNILDLSPHGALFTTENQNSFSITPGEKLDVLLEPRGWFPMPIRIQAQARRITDELHPKTGNPFREIGFQFMHIDTINRAAFSDLLKDILIKMKKQAGGT